MLLLEKDTQFKVNLKNKRIIIIHSGSELKIDDADTILQANEINNCLKKLGLDSSLEQIDDLKIIQKISNYDKEKTVIFNLVESFNGSDSKSYQFTALLDCFKIPYSGANSAFLLLASDKIITKQILKSGGIKTPKWLESKNANNKKLPDKYIVKSTTEHCSLGIDDNSVSDKNILSIIEEKQKQYGGIWFAEEYIDGREFNISVMEIDGKPIIMPLAETIFKNNHNQKHKIVDYSAKWHGEDEAYNDYGRSFIYDKKDQKLLKNIEKTSLKVWKLFKMNNYVRIDFRIDKNNKIFVIDINANPCLASDAGFIAATQEYGLSQEDTLINILKNSLNICFAKNLFV